MGRQLSVTMDLKYKILTGEDNQKKNLGIKALAFCFCSFFLASVLLNVYYIGKGNQDAADMKTKVVGRHVKKSGGHGHGIISTDDGKPVGAGADWTDIADSLLCSTGGDAKRIRDGLKVTDPSAQWIVFLTDADASDNWRGSTESYYPGYKKCGYNMFVWKSQDFPSGDCDTDAGRLLIDTEVAYGWKPRPTVNAIVQGLSNYDLDYNFVVAWGDGAWKWASYGTQSCAVHNDNAFLYL